MRLNISTPALRFTRLIKTNTSYIKYVNKIRLNILLPFTCSLQSNSIQSHMLSIYSYLLQECTVLRNVVHGIKWTLFCSLNHIWHHGFPRIQYKSHMCVWKWNNIWISKVWFLMNLVLELVKANRRPSNFNKDVASKIESKKKTFSFLMRLDKMRLN